MRKAMVFLLLGLWLTGCAHLAQTPAPEPTPAACQGTPLPDPPVLAGVEAFGLEGPQFWLPGQAVKVNWMDQVHGFGNMRIRLQRAGASGSTYTAEFVPGPTLVSFPAAGCWDVTVEWQGQTAGIRVFLEPAHLAGVLGAGGNDPNLPGVASAVWKDESTAQELLKAAGGQAGQPPRGRPQALVYLVWETSAGPFYTPMLYLPGTDGNTPMIVVGKSLLTGDCLDADKPVAGQISTKMASQLEKNLGSMLKVGREPLNPWAQFTNNCLRFTAQD